MKKIMMILMIMLMVLGSNLAFADTQKSEKPEMKIVTIKINHLNAKEVARIIAPYAGPWGRIREVESSNSVIIQGSAETIQKLTGIIKTIDIRKKDLLFTFDLILGERGTKIKTPVPDELKSDPLFKELKSLLNFDSFKKLDASFMRIQDSTASTQQIYGGLRVEMYPRVAGKQINIELSIYRRTGMAGGKHTIERLLSTSLSITDGERTVVGVSKLNGGDKSLIIILKGKILN